jgi:hypothetical protein
MRAPARSPRNITLGDKAMLLDDLLAASRSGKVEIDPFDYSAFFPIATFVGGATNIPINTPINADSDFVVRYVNIAAFSAVGVPVATPDYLVQFVDTGSGRNLQDNPQHVLNIMGTAQLPFIWPEPKLLKGNSVLQTLLTNRTIVAADVFITFCGFKVFYVQSFTRDMLLQHSGF